MIDMSYEEGFKPNIHNLGIGELQFNTKDGKLFVVDKFENVFEVNKGGAVPIDDSIVAVDKLWSSKKISDENNTIVEEGSNANGKWLKFSNGVLIQYGTHHLNITAHKNTEQHIDNLPFPISFSVKPTVFVSGASYKTTSFFISCVNDGNVTTTKFDVFVKHLINDKAPGSYVFFYAVGRWK